MQFLSAVVTGAPLTEDAASDSQSYIIGLGALLTTMVLTKHSQSELEETLSVRLLFGEVADVHLVDWYSVGTPDLSHTLGSTPGRRTQGNEYFAVLTRPLRSRPARSAIFRGR